MTFKRVGTPEPLQTVKFRCTKCGNETSTLIDGKCESCNIKATKKEDVEKIVEEAIKKEGEK